MKRKYTAHLLLGNEDGARKIFVSEKKEVEKDFYQNKVGPSCWLVSCIGSSFGQYVRVCVCVSVKFMCGKKQNYAPNTHVHS